MSWLRSLSAAVDEAYRQRLRISSEVVLFTTYSCCVECTSNKCYLHIHSCSGTCACQPRSVCLLVGFFVRKSNILPEKCKSCFLFYAYVGQEHNYRVFHYGYGREGVTSACPVLPAHLLSVDYQYQFLMYTCTLITSLPPFLWKKATLVLSILLYLQYQTWQCRSVCHLATSGTNQNLI